MKKSRAWDVARNRAVEIEWAGDTIVRVQSIEADPNSLPRIVPGLIDIQINGFAGVNFGSPEITREQIEQVSGTLLRTGVTHYLPTLITDDVARMGEALRRLVDAASSHRSPVLGFHLEGPYLSSVDGPRGAHPIEFCKNPDWDEFRRLQDSAQGMIRMMTLAPERPGAIPFIERAVASGVRIALGHTQADRSTILSALDAGASLATHLGNAVSDQIQRHHNVIFDLLGDDRLSASLIVDGHHLPPHVVKIFTRAKGLERTILVSDAVQYAGLPPGTYDGGYRKFEVRADGFIGVVGEPRLAGSGLLLHQGVENLVKFTGISWADAFATASINPARWIGFDDRLGKLEVGYNASFVEFDLNESESSLSIRRVVYSGEDVAIAT